MGDPPWLLEARKHIGVAEIPGTAENPVIQKWLSQLKAAWNSEAVPWCGTFVAHCMRECGIPVPKHWYRAMAWANSEPRWGSVMPQANYGSVVVYTRKGGGHVGLVVGRDRFDNVMTLGGNQGDKVSIAPFHRSRVVAYAWPPGFAVPPYDLPLLDSDGKVSTQEG